MKSTKPRVPNWNLRFKASTQEVAPAKPRPGRKIQRRRRVVRPSLPNPLPRLVITIRFPGWRGRQRIQYGTSVEIDITEPFLRRTPSWIRQVVPDNATIPGIPQEVGSYRFSRLFDLADIRGDFLTWFQAL